MQRDENESVARPDRSVPAHPSSPELMVRLTEIFEATTDLAGAADPDLRILFLNQGGRRVLGYDPHEAIPTTLDKYHPELSFRTITEQAIPVALRDGSWRGEMVFVGKDGREIWTSQILIAHKDPEGNLVYLSTVARDISKSKRAEQELKRFFTLALDMLCVADFNGYFKQLNPVWERTLGFTLEQLMAEPFLHFVHPDDREATIAAAQHLAKGGEIVSFENRYRCKDGTYRWIAWNSASDVDQGLIYACARDITERRRAEQTIREQAEALTQLSTPLIPISDRILVMPLIGVVDSKRAEQVLSTLLDGISRTQAEVAILDITGVGMVDTQVADALVRAAKAVQLLGAKVVLTGIRPEVAQTLVTLGGGLGTIATRGTLQAGIAYAMDAPPSPRPP